MSESNYANNILKEILNILSLLSEKTKDSFILSLDYHNKSEIRKKFPEISFFKQKTISYNTNDLYIFLICKIYYFLNPVHKINFSSCHPVLYLKRIINYMKLLTESNINIVEDDIVKIFFILLIIFFDENLQNKKSNKIFDLDESFFQGTFIEFIFINF